MNYQTGGPVLIAAGGGLALTGSNTFLLTAIAAVLLLVGGTFVRLARRSRDERDVQA